MKITGTRSTITFDLENGFLLRAQGDLVRERRAYARGVLFSCRRRDVLMCDKRERKH